MAEILSQILLIGFLLTVCTFSFGSAQLQCWRCDPCPDPFDNSSSQVQQVTCTVAQTVCVKNTVKVLNKQAQISKGCVETCTPSSSNFFGQGAFVDCCNTNFCNFAHRNQISIIIYFFFIAIFAFIFF